MYSVVWIDLPSHLKLEPFPAYVPMLKAMSRLGTLVRYDHRGFGLSERGITEFPLDDLVKDLEAVVDRLALETFIGGGRGAGVGDGALAGADVGGRAVRGPWRAGAEVEAVRVWAVVAQTDGLSTDRGTD